LLTQNWDVGQNKMSTDCAVHR